MTLSNEEMIRILEDIARDGSNAAARIAAIRQLREIAGDAPSAGGGFEALDGGRDELAARRVSGGGGLKGG